MALNSTSDNNSEFSLNSVELIDVLITKVANIRKLSAQYPHSRDALEMVLHRIDLFAQEQDDQYSLIRFKSIVYQLELAYKLNRINWENHEITAFSPVDELLIYMNYNSKRYIQMLQEWLSERIDKNQPLVEQLQTMQFYEKAFSQIQQKPEVALHEDYVPIKSVLANWFEHENRYLENQAELWLKTKEIPDVNANKVKPIQKVEWSLSGDQIALLIRSADDTRLIKAKSLTSVFKLVIPNIRTPFTETLSPDATRTSAYHAEQTDKVVVIDALKKMIEFINGY